jgi:serine/threonine protein kinase
VHFCGYWPPEYVKHQIISKEFDIFSLGVIIVKIITGHDGYNRVADIPTHKFVKQVCENWRKRLHRTWSHSSLEVLCKQVKRCIELALECLKSNRQERPTIQDIIYSLKETETMIGDRELQIEQFYKENDGEPTIFSESSRNNSRPTSSG